MHLNLRGNLKVNIKFSNTTYYSIKKIECTRS